MCAKPKYNPNFHHRRSIRLKAYDYAQAGFYFITICCHNRACLFGEVVDGKMIFNDAGKIAIDCWLEIPNHFPNATLHEYIAMPNHFHGIIELVGAKHFSPINPQNNTNETKNFLHDNYFVNDAIATNSPGNSANNPGWRAKNVSPLRSPSKTIGSIVRGFKIGVTKWMRQHTNVYNVWQCNYYEHIIRDEHSFHLISEYIINNPAKWKDDKFYTF